MERDKNKIFANASKKLSILRKKKLLQTFILSGLLLTQARFPVDLFAEETQKPRETTTREIQIQCNEEDLNLAEHLCEIIWLNEIRDKATANLFTRLENAGVTIKIIEDSNEINGCYIIGQKEIRIPRNAITRDINGEIELIDTLRHEGIHFLQDDCGIFEDCKRLSPKEACIVEIMVELDAYIKSAVMERPQIRDLNSSFDCLVGITPFLFDKAFYNSKVYTLYQSKTNKILNNEEKLSLSDVMSKFNMKEFGNYNDINHLIDAIIQNLDDKMKNKIDEAEKEYNKNRVFTEYMGNLADQNKKDNTTKNSGIKLKNSDTIKLDTGRE